MMYQSTRGGMQPQAFTDILLEGLAPDGGLTIPVSVPKVSLKQLNQWRGLKYNELAFNILSLFITDIDAKDLKTLVDAAYSTDNFDSQDIVPLKQLQGNLYLLGLSQGPTLAFKDIAMQFLGQIFEYVLTKRKAKLNILGATSGDTGSAAEYALKGKKGVQVFMLSPQGRMSSFQRAQMYSLQDKNIHNIAIDGVFDDCQDIVKQLASDLDFKAKYNLGAVNSINWGRIAAQIVYYFWGWLQATTSDEQLVDFAVPSGNFGNILAGHFAREMGLPINKLILATNENNVLEEFFNTGIYKPRSSANTYATSSPSMDISKASNFERFVFDLLGKDAAKVKQIWQQLDEDGYFDLSHMLDTFSSSYGFVAGTSSHVDRLNTIKQIYQDTNVIVDPHTADGIKVAKEHLQPSIPMLVLETALPVKFDEIIKEAINIEPKIPVNLADLHSLEQKVIDFDCDASLVRNYIVQNS